MRRGPAALRAARMCCRMGGATRVESQELLSREAYQEGSCSEPGAAAEPAAAAAAAAIWEVEEPEPPPVQNISVSLQAHARMCVRFVGWGGVRGRRDEVGKGRGGEGGTEGVACGRGWG